VKAGIVTCGGLCPGLNTVIRTLVTSLWYNYDVRTIYGIKWGYRGFYEDFPENWIELNPEKVAKIHSSGGTIIGSSRGGFDAEKMIKAIKD
jgi:6-phosphofructokinase 1